MKKTPKHHLEITTKPSKPKLTILQKNMHQTNRPNTLRYAAFALGNEHAGLETRKVTEVPEARGWRKISLVEKDQLHFPGFL